MPSLKPGGQLTEDGASSHMVSGILAPMLPLSLTPPDPEQLRQRLIVTRSIPQRPGPDLLEYTPLTFKQQRQHRFAKAMQHEPLPVFQQNQAEYIDRKTRERLISAGRELRMERTECNSSSLHLPLIPDHLKERQHKNSPKSHVAVLSHTVSPPVSNPLHFNSVEEVMHAGIHSPCKIAQIIRNNPDLGFFYMISASSGSPYDLKIVTYAGVNKSNYFTISERGVVHYSSDDTYFVALDRWEQEYLYHQQLLCIPTFALFRKRKAFRMWHSNVRYKTISACKRTLQNRLFFMHESLRPALVNIREMCYHISSMDLCRIEKQRTYTLEDFQSAQYTHLTEVFSRLREFRELVKEVTVTACHMALLEAGFISDHDKDGDQRRPGADLEKLYEETLDKRSYIYQHNKKSECSRLTRFICLILFIRLADYLVMSTLHTLTVNSVSKLLSKLQEHNMYTLSYSLIQSWASADNTHDTEESVSKQNAEALLSPLLVTELMLDTHALSFQPSLKDFQEIIGEIISCFQETVLLLEPLVLDSGFDAITQPVIKNQHKVKTFGNGPDLEFTLENDQHLQNIIRNIKNTIQFTFADAEAYAHTFRSFHLMYKENQSLDLEALQKQSHDLAFFEERLERYHRQYKEVMAIKLNRHLGVLLVDTTSLKSKLASCLLHCLEDFEVRALTPE